MIVVVGTTLERPGAISHQPSATSHPQSVSHQTMSLSKGEVRRAVARMPYKEGG